MPRHPLSRRDLLKECLAAGVLLVPAGWREADVLHAWLEAQAARTPTAHVEMGPFYKRRAPATTALRSAGDPWSPDGRFIAMGDVDDETLSKGGVDVVDATTRAVAARLDASGMPAMNLAVLPTGVVVAATGPTLRSWSVPALASSPTK